MTDFLSRALPAPKNWQDFEILMFDLFSRRWRTNDAELHGRKGQAQAGVDVFGTDRVEDKWTGVQCKGKDADYGGAVTEKELRQEVEKALTFQPPLDVFVMATTAPNDVEIQRAAREITQEHQKTGRFEVRVHGWDTLRQVITDYSDVILKHFKDFAPVDLVAAFSTGQTRSDQQLARLEAIVRGSSSRIIAEVREARDGDDPLALRISEIAKLNDEGSPRAAIRALTRIREEEWDGASPLAKFRILANLGSARLALGEEALAIELYQESYTVYPDYPSARAVMALVKLMGGDRPGALSLATAALAEDPSRARAVAIIIETTPETTSLPEIEQSLPQEARDSAETKLHLSFRAQRTGDQPAALRYAEEALAITPNDWRVQAMVAEALVHPLLGEGDQIAITRVMADDARADLERATELLRKAWNDLSARDSSYLGRHVAANLITFLKLSGRDEEASDVLDQAMLENPDYPPLLRNVAQRAFNEDDWKITAEAIDAIPEAETEFADHLLRAKAAIQLEDFGTAQEAARRLIAAARDNEQLDVAAAVSLQTEGLSGEEFADAVGRKLSEHPNSIIFRSLIFDAVPKGHPLRDRIVQEIEELAAGNLTVRERVHAAETLSEGGSHSLAADLYAPLHDDRNDSFALYRHVQALHLADRRAEAREIYEALPLALKTSSRYVRLGIAIYERAGLLKPAVRLLESAFKTRDQVEDRLIWMQMLTRLGREADFLPWLRSVPETIGGTPHELMMLAVFLDRYLTGDPKVLAIGYRALRSGYGDPQVHLGFAMSLMIMGAAGRTKSQEPAQVSPGVGVVLRSQATGNHLFRVIEEAEDLRVERGEISSSDRLAQQLLGLKKSDVIEIDRIGSGPETFQIEELQDRYVFALQRTLREFESLFPGHPAFGSVSIKESDGDQRFEPLFAMVRRRANFGEEIKKQYRSGFAPMSLLAKFSGRSVFDLWETFRVGNDSVIMVAQGFDAEFAMGRAAAQAGVLVVDPLSIYAWVRLGLTPTILKSREKLAVLQSSIDLLRGLLSEREQLRGQRTGTLGWDGEHYRMIEISEGEADELISIARQSVELAESIVLVPAEGKQALPQTTANLFEDLRPAFSDLILATLDGSRALLTDDLAFRLVAQESGARTAWTQTFLQYQRRERVLSETEYRDAVDVLLASQYDFTQFGHAEVLAELGEAGWAINDRLQRYLGVMIRPTVDSGSIVRLLASLVLDSLPQAPSAGSLATFHIELVDALRNAGRYAEARQIYMSLPQQIEQNIGLRLRRQHLPPRLLASTSHTPPAVLSQDLNEIAARSTRVAFDRLRKGGLNVL
jgi:tetratricopeptide (TPR) repeat protein